MLLPNFRQLLNVVVLLAVLWVNALAGAGSISGESIGLIANRYPSYFLPADYVFGIWGVIYLSLVAFAVYQALPAQADSALLDRLGLGWALNGVLNVAWIVAFSFSRFGIALVLMAALLGNLVWIVERTGQGRLELRTDERWLVAYPFTLYLSWISVAFIANVFQFATYAGWSGLGVGAPAWSAIMMTVATALAVFMVVFRAAWIFPLVSGWALVGIANRFPDVPTITVTAYVMTGLGLAAMVGGLVWRRGRRA